MPDQKKPVWITECVYTLFDTERCSLTLGRFASTNWNTDAPLPQDHVENFAKVTTKYLDELEWVERYAWFGPMRDAGTVGQYARMLDDDGKLTPLGKAYRDE